MALNKKKIIYLGLSIIFLIVTSFFLLLIFFDSGDKLSISRVKINRKIIKVELATSPWSHYRGLSNRKTLCSDCGMLFIFTDKQERKFVMRNMNFPLDIIFVADGRIINIAAKLPPEGANPINIYKSLAPADQVLEINGGEAEKYNFKIGDRVKLLK